MEDLVYKWFYQFFCTILLLFAGTVTGMEVDMREHNPFSWHIPNLQQQCMLRIADSIYPSTQRKSEFHKIPQLNALIQGALFNVPGLMQDVLYDPISRELFSRVVVDYVNKKNLFNLGRNNLISQIKNEPDEVLSKKLKQVFVDNLQAKESYLDYAKAIADPTGICEGVVPLERLCSNVNFMTNTILKPLLILWSMESIKVFITHTKYNSFLNSVDLSYGNSLFWLLLAHCFYYPRLINKYPPRQQNLLPYKYIIGSLLTFMSVRATYAYLYTLHDYFFDCLEGYLKR